MKIIVKLIKECGMLNAKSTNITISIKFLAPRMRLVPFSTLSHDSQLFVLLFCLCSSVLWPAAIRFQ